MNTLTTQKLESHNLAICMYLINKFDKQLRIPQFIPLFQIICTNIVSDKMYPVQLWVVLSMMVVFNKAATLYNEEQMKNVFPNINYTRTPFNNDEMITVSTDTIRNIFPTISTTKNNYVYKQLTTELPETKTVIIHGLWTSTISNRKNT